MSDDGISVVVEGEDAPAAETRSRGRSIEEIEAETLRQNERAARLQREAALNNVNAALLTIDTESRAAKLEYTAAMETGDFETAADAQARLAAGEARRTTLQAQSEAIERMPRSFEERLNHFTPATADWMRRHRDWVEDPRKSAKLQGAHHLAVSEGHDPDSPSYFDFVEKFIGLRDMRGGNGAAGSSARRASGDINPGDVNSHIRNGGKSVYLTEGEKKRATDGTLVWNYGPNQGKPIGTQEFARRKAAMHAEGRYDRLG